MGVQTFYPLYIYSPYIRSCYVKLALTLKAAAASEVIRSRYPEDHSKFF